MRFFYLSFIFTVTAVPTVVLAQEFTPLTNLPGISEVATASTIPAFFNNLYKLCIGAAAVIAILQIMRAGVYFMFNKGSVAQNEKAKHLLTNSILGLLLVLSPAIVFGIINPDILDLRFDVSKLKTDGFPMGGESVAGQVNAILQACSMTATNDQLTCVGVRAVTIQREYEQCLTANAASACASDARADGRRAIQACVPNVTSEQLNCLSEQIGSRVGAGTVDPMGRCEVFDPASLHAVRRNTDNTYTCPLGETKVEANCCRTIGGDFGCCGRLASASDYYILAYYYTQTSQSGAQCRQEYVQPFADQTTCNQRKPREGQPVLPPNGNGDTYSAPTIVKSCERGPQNYTIPRDSSVRLCQ